MKARAFSNLIFFSQRVRGAQDKISFINRNRRLVAGQREPVVVARSEGQAVVQRDGLKDCAKLVVAVRAAAQNVKPPVDFGVSGERKGALRHLGTASLSLVDKKRRPPLYDFEFRKRSISVHEDLREIDATISRTRNTNAGARELPVENVRAVL